MHDTEYKYGLSSDGLASAGSEQLSACLLHAALANHGCLLLPGLLTGEAVKELRQLTQTALDDQSRGACENQQHPELEYCRGSTAAIDRIARTRHFVEEGGGALLADNPQLLAALLALYEHLGVYKVVGEYLDSTPIISANKATARRVSPEVVGAWHQDGAFLGDDCRAINLWLTLSDCGVDAPGLDIVPERLDRLVSTGGDGAYFDWSVSDSLVARDYGVVRPTFSAGDLLIFDELFLHKTAAQASMSGVRYALELWSFAPEKFPANHVGISWPSTRVD
jgi:hypothetical protein